MRVKYFVLMIVYVSGYDNFTLTVSSTTYKIVDTILGVSRNFPNVRITVEEEAVKENEDEIVPHDDSNIFTTNQTGNLVCESKYGRREYKGKWVTDPPPLLLSFPGSGNTWTRLLVEIATGIYTGDIYTDHSLKSVFAAEKSCGKRVSAVKAHPQDLNISVSGELYHTLSGNKCQRIGTTFFEKAIIIHRNPFRAFWSEYQRGGSRDRHTKGIPQNQFNVHVWGDFALDNARQFRQAWDEKYAHIFSTFSPSRFLVTSYERLTSDTWKEKKDELKKIVQFLGFPIDEGRIECAFLISFNPKVIRRNSHHDVSFEKAFGDQDIRCKSWEIIQSMSPLTNEKMREYNLDLSPPMNCENMSYL